jgi:hypothetical protein
MISASERDVARQETMVFVSSSSVLSVRAREKFRHRNSCRIDSSSSSSSKVSNSSSTGLSCSTAGNSCMTAVSSCSTAGSTGSSSSSSGLLLLYGMVFYYAMYATITMLFSTGSTHTRTDIGTYPRRDWNRSSSRMYYMVEQSSSRVGMVEGNRSSSRIVVAESLNYLTFYYIGEGFLW